MDNENGLPLLLPAPAQQQPTFPQLNVNVTPQGMVLSLELAPGITGTVIRVGPDMLNDITKLWRQIRANEADQMRVIEHVRQSKNN